MYSMSTFVFPNILFCRLNLLIILNQNLFIRDKNDYEFDKIISYFHAI